MGKCKLHELLITHVTSQHRLTNKENNTCKRQTRRSLLAAIASWWKLQGNKEQVRQRRPWMGSRARGTGWGRPGGEEALCMRMGRRAGHPPVRNFSAIVATGHRPHQLLFEEVHDVSYLMVFGCAAHTTSSTIVKWSLPAEAPE
jgi:hypothetical protein